MSEALGLITILQSSVELFSKKLQIKVEQCESTYRGDAEASNAMMGIRHGLQCAEPVARRMGMGADNAKPFSRRGLRHARNLWMHTGVVHGMRPVVQAASGGVGSAGSWVGGMRGDSKPCGMHTQEIVPARLRRGHRFPGMTRRHANISRTVDEASEPCAKKQHRVNGVWVVIESRFVAHVSAQQRHGANLSTGHHLLAEIDRSQESRRNYWS